MGVCFTPVHRFACGDNDDAGVVEVNHGVVRTMVARAGAGTAGEVVRRTGGGERSGVYEARPSGYGEAVIVKVYAHEWTWKQAKELYVYRLLAAAAPASVPSVIAAEDETNPTGHAYTVMTKVGGSPLSELGAQLDQATWRRLYRRIGALLAAIHEVEQPAYGYLVTEVLEPLPTNEEYMRRQFDKKLCEFRGRGGAAEVAAEVERIVADRAALFAECRGPVLCHNDLHEGNVLVVGQGERCEVRGIVDVENAIAADPLLDIAKTHYYSVHGDPDKLAGLTEGYGAPLADHEERLHLYRLYHALELWDWFTLVGKTRHLPAIASDIVRLTR